MTDVKRSECTSVSQYTEWLSKTYENKEYVFYRGQSNIKYSLKPSVLRDDKRVHCENKIYLKVLSECSNDFSTDMSHITILSKMQHYGVPTRLLDITTNALENIINPLHLLRNYFIIPKKDNPRIIRQSGAFIMVGLQNTIDPERVKIRKIIIPCAYKHKILKELESLGISKITLHPELYKMAEYITESFLDNIEI